MRRSPGAIRDAIFQCLRESGEALSVSDITMRVERSIGAGVRPSSIRSYLRLNVGRHFEQPTRGYYGFRETEAEWQDEVVPSSITALLYHEDCFKWMAAQKANSIQAVVTDPPYGLVEYSAEQQQKLRSRSGGVWRVPPSFDGHQRSPLPRFTTLTAEDLARIDAFFLAWGREILRIVVPGANVIVASNPLLSDRVSRALAGAGLERRGEIARLVMTMRGGDRPKNAHEEFADVSVLPRSMWEPWLVFRKPLEGRVQDNLRKWKTGGFRRVSETKPFGDVIVSTPTGPKERGIAPHPSLKPQAFLRQLVRAVLPLGVGKVYDPFAGAGSTLAAARSVGYPSVGTELDFQYFNIAREAIARLAALPVPGDQDKSNESETASGLSREASPFLSQARRERFA